MTGIAINTNILLLQISGESAWPEKFKCLRLNKSRSCRISNDPVSKARCKRRFQTLSNQGNKYVTPLLSCLRQITIIKVPTNTTPENSVRYTLTIFIWYLQEI